VLKGLSYAIDHPDEAAQILQKHERLADPAIAAAELRIMKAFVYTAVTDKCGLGYIDPQRVETTVGIVKQFLKPTGPVAAADLYAPGFVNTTCK
jgi:NitT/TauT family transport system substrate-binding protein